MHISECSTWECINSFSEWVSAFGTILISGTALWLSFKDRMIHMQASFNSGIIPGDNPHILNQYVYILSGVNLGLRNITITNYHWKYRKQPFSQVQKTITFPYMDKKLSYLCSKLPCSLSDDQEVHIFHPKNFFSELDNTHDFIFSNNRYLAFYRIFTFNIFFDTSIGKPIKAKISFRVRKSIWSQYKNITKT